MNKSEQIQFILDNYMTMPQKTMATHIGRSNCFVRSVIQRYNIVIPREVIDRFKRESQFKKGHAPANKGRSMKEYCSAEAMAGMAKTQFHKGHLPHNTRYDGYISIRNSKRIPYKWIRVAPGKFMLLHRYVWIQAHGPIPRGYNIQFKDGNTLNCDIDNLYMIHKRDQAPINKIGGKQIPYEVLDTVKLTININRKIKKYEKQSIRPEQSPLCAAGKARG